MNPGLQCAVRYILFLLARYITLWNVNILHISSLTSIIISIRFQADGCNLFIGHDFIEMQNMIGSMNKQQKEKFKKDTCALPQTIFSVVNLYPFLNEVHKTSLSIGRFFINKCL